MKTAPINYQPNSPPKASSPVLAILLATLAFSLSLTAAWVSYSKMDLNRQFTEGWHQYFVERFPFRTIFALCAASVLLSMFCMIAIPRRRWPAALLIVCNILWSSFWIRCLLRN